MGGPALTRTCAARHRGSATPGCPTCCRVSEPRAAEAYSTDERHDCRDIGPAYVSSTVWGTASMRDRQVGLGAVLAPQCRNATPPLVTASAAHVSQRLIAPDDMSSPTQQSPTCLSASASRRSLSSRQFRHSAPDMRGSAQPSTDGSMAGRIAVIKPCTLMWMHRSSSSIAEPSGQTSSFARSSVGTSCNAPIHCRGIRNPAFRCEFRSIVITDSVPS